jgi:hypothetical protein
LATFQYRGGHGPKAEGGGPLEIDNGGHVLRSGSAEDGAAAGELIRPYSVELLPAADRVVSINTAMHEMDGKSRTVQVWQFSSLRVLRTLTLSCGVHVATSSTTPASRACSMTARVCWCIRLIVGFT